MEHTPLKVAIIGGGSSYTPEIIEGFIKRHATLPIDEIWLVDIEAGREKLEIVGGLAERMIQASGISCKIVLTLDLDAALIGAKYVTTQLRVGLLDARVHDERIPAKYGLLGQETTGIGGFSKALRTIPVILEIAHRMEVICPDAWLINFTNPAGIVTEAVLKHSRIKAIGLCNVPVNMRKNIANLLNSDDFVFMATGLNHYVWGTQVYHKGNEVMQTLLPQLMANDDYNPKNIGDTPFDPEQIRKMGLMPCYYHAYYYLEEEKLAHALEDYAHNGTRAEVVKRVEHALFEKYKDPNLSEKPVELEQRGGAYYSDAACSLINDLYNDARTLMIVDVQNNQTHPYLPADAVIETTCLITSAGPIPLTIQPLPDFARAELVKLKSFEALTIEAAVTGDYDLALLAISSHPLTRAGVTLKKVLDALLEVHADYLPKFNS